MIIGLKLKFKKFLVQKENIVTQFVTVRLTFFFFINTLTFHLLSILFNHYLKRFSFYLIFLFVFYVFLFFLLYNIMINYPFIFLSHYTLFCFHFWIHSIFTMVFIFIDLVVAIIIPVIVKGSPF